MAGDDVRAAALDAHLAERARHGFEVETRTRTQAVISRRQRRYLRLPWRGTAPRQERHVVSVDHEGTITCVEAEPRRW